MEKKNKEYSDKETIKLSYNLLQKFYDKNTNLNEKNFKLNYGLSVEKEQLLKAKNMIDSLKNELDESKKMVEENNKKKPENYSSLSKFFKGYAQQLSDNRKNELMKEYDENCVKYF